MNGSTERDERPGRTELGRSLLDNGFMTSDWAPAFEAVPRAAFLPGLMWPHDPTTGRAVTVNRTDDPAAWWGYADSNVPIVTQWDDGRHTGTEPGGVFTSSSSMPSVVFSMLADLDVHPGQSVLEIGTGTGWNAALLAHRVGAGNVVSVELDPAVSEGARQALRHFGYRDVRVITGDGLLGYPPAAPYDRVIATCGLRSGMFNWVRQTAPGGIVVVPWGTYFGYTEATARLVVAADGTSASGHFTRPVNFMRMRSQRLARPEHSSYVPAQGMGDAVRSTTTVTEAEFLTGSYDVEAFAVGLRVPDCTHTPDRKRDGKRPVWFYSLTDMSWAVVIFRDSGKEATVHQSGNRRLWDEVEAAFRWWLGQGRPDFDRFGLTVTADRQVPWLDDPSNVLSG
ncbi:methyltransferase domain-containing protein [Streptomyces sp. NBC_01476]|uniref:methyltransferase domain-containing protein n=1 Tax=Streptomyces sp. NBC_01476 TaxID=2903881 RepID=UPI002E3438D4|nr:methyltransferase domain-containing protein [Streptomyces sp. NBC_01476]